MIVPQAILEAVFKVPKSSVIAGISTLAAYVHGLGKTADSCRIEISRYNCKNARPHFCCFLIVFFVCLCVNLNIVFFCFFFSRHFEDFLSMKNENEFIANGQLLKKIYLNSENLGILRLASTLEKNFIASKNRLHYDVNILFMKSR